MQPLPMCKLFMGPRSVSEGEPVVSKVRLPVGYLDESASDGEPVERVTGTLMVRPPRLGVQCCCAVRGQRLKGVCDQACLRGPLEARVSRFAQQSGEGCEPSPLFGNWVDDGGRPPSNQDADVCS
jgi:hypothetical protein